MKKILIGIDEHEESLGAARTGVVLAQKVEAEPRFVHAVPFARPAVMPMSDVDFDAVREQALEAVQKRVTERVSRVLEGTPWAGRTDDLLSVHAGSGARVILDEARRLPADIVLLGPHRKKGLFDFGRTARGVIAHSPCPLWVQKDDRVDFDRLLVPVDLSESSAGQVRYACDLARAFGVKVHLLHCFEGPYFAYGAGVEPVHGIPSYVVDAARDAARKRFRELAESIDWDGVEHETEFVESDPAKYVIDSQEPADLMVIGAHGGGWISTTALGSIAYGLLKHATGSVVVVRDRTD